MPNNLTIAYGKITDRYATKLYTAMLPDDCKPRPPKTEFRKTIFYHYDRDEASIWVSDNTMIVTPMNYGDYLDITSGKPVTGVCLL